MKPRSHGWIDPVRAGRAALWVVALLLLGYGLGWGPVRADEADRPNATTVPVETRSDVEGDRARGTRPSANGRRADDSRAPGAPGAPAPTPVSATHGGLVAPPSEAPPAERLPAVRDDSPSDDQSRTMGTSLAVAGRKMMIFDWSRDACEPLDIPDLPARAYRDSYGRVQLFAAHFTNRRLIGDWNSLRHPCKVVMDSQFDPDPSNFSDAEWIGAPYTPDGRRVYALVHNEYQGWRHAEHPQCEWPDHYRCWYNAVTFASSNDGGLTFRQPRAPGHLVAASPYRYAPGKGPFGVFAPSNIVRGKDGWYYTFLRMRQYRAQESGSCLMRTRDLSDPRSWRAWNGSSFTVRFANPYSGSVTTSTDHVCAPVAPDEIGELAESLTYNTYLRRYVLLGRAGAYDPARREVVWGVYFSLSRDLLHWTPRKLVFETEFVQTFSCGDSNPIAYPVLIDHDSASRNFETTDQRAHLYFTRFNYEDCHITLNRDLFRVPVEFSK